MTIIQEPTTITETEVEDKGFVYTRYQYKDGELQWIKWYLNNEGALFPAIGQSGLETRFQTLVRSTAEKSLPSPGT